MSTHVEVAVVGGGQAGLAVGHFLAREGRRFVILEAAETPAAAWRARWDSLRLFTPARYDSLPGAPFPGDPDHYPTRDEVVDYLTDYARDLPVELGSRVESVRRDGEGYSVSVAGGDEYTADQVVIATGPFQTPRIPALAAGLDGGVVQMHSSAYRSPAALPSGRVLVVGGGNTGYQIAEELAGSHEVHLSVGARQLPLPQRVLGRDLFRLLVAAGAMSRTVDSPLGRRMKGRETLIGSSPRGARRRGIALHARTAGAAGASVSFADGTRVDGVAAVVWATGFGVDHAFVDAPVFDARGAVIHQRGVTASPGLYFLGLPWLHTRGSALLGWVKGDAEHIAGCIQRHSAPARVAR